MKQLSNKVQVKCSALTCFCVIIFDCGLLSRPFSFGYDVVYPFSFLLRCSLVFSHLFIFWFTTLNDISQISHLKWLVTSDIFVTNCLSLTLCCYSINEERKPILMEHTLRQISTVSECLYFRFFYMITMETDRNSTGLNNAKQWKNIYRYHLKRLVKSILSMGISFPCVFS